jgi:hypothetical protein
LFLVDDDALLRTHARIQLGTLNGFRYRRQARKTLQTMFAE